MEYTPRIRRIQYTYSIQANHRLQLRLLRLGSEIGHQQLPHLRCSLINIVAHALGADALADDVKVEAGR